MKKQATYVACLDAEYSWMEPSETSANITSFSNEESLVFSAAKAGMVNAKTQESVRSRDKNFFM